MDETNAKADADTEAVLLARADVEGDTEAKAKAEVPDADADAAADADADAGADAGAAAAAAAEPDPELTSAVAARIDAAAQVDGSNELGLQSCMELEPIVRNDPVVKLLSARIAALERALAAKQSGCELPNMKDAV